MKVEVLEYLMLEYKEITWYLLLKNQMCKKNLQEVWKEKVLHFVLEYYGEPLISAPGFYFLCNFEQFTKPL